MQVVIHTSVRSNGLLVFFDHLFGPCGSALHLVCHLLVHRTAAKHVAFLFVLSANTDFFELNAFAVIKLTQFGKLIGFVVKLNVELESLLALVEVGLVLGDLLSHSV